ncbi:uncharacterized protein LOC141911638 [Tubulanus polymorphus]|uniref:uncharacterized protein LOC141911638 n=1 Tax=Tubulanus polymorphus TaxID=672921 RepID=UPI003DA5DADC
MFNLLNTMSTTAGPSIVQFLELASASATTINIRWAITREFTVNLIGAKVHYQRYGSTLVKYSDLLPPESTNYSIDKLLANTNYKICLALYNNSSSVDSPSRHCMDAMTTTWHIPVSIGSSIGAFLALAIIVLIVLMSQCKQRHMTNRVRRKSSRYDSQFDSQYDSVAHDPESSSYHPGAHGEFSDITIHEIHEECWENDKGGVMLEVPNMNHCANVAPHMHICAHNPRCFSIPTYPGDVGSLPLSSERYPPQTVQYNQPQPSTSQSRIIADDTAENYDRRDEQEQREPVTPTLDAMSPVFCPIASLPYQRSLDAGTALPPPGGRIPGPGPPPTTKPWVYMKKSPNSMNGRLSNSDHQLCTRVNTV